MRLFCVLILLFMIAMPAVAHEDRQVDEFEIEFGWQHEPVYTGQMNGPELYIFVATTEDHDHAAADDHMHNETLEVTGETGIPELSLTISPAEEGGLLVEYTVTNFMFSTENANGEHVEGEGHAHILVDGEEAAMVFGDPVRLPDIMPGEHEITLQLNANSHQPLALNGELLHTSVMVMVEGDDHEDEAMGEMAEEGEADDHDHSDEESMSEMTDHDEEGEHEHDDEVAEDHSHDAEVSEMAAESTGHTHGEGRVAVTDVDLQVEVMFGPESVTLRLQPVAGEPGHYSAAMIPTLPGDYTFRLFGTANGVEIDESFTSADGQFDTVEPAGDILFPAQPTTADLLARIEALEAVIAELHGE